MTTYNDASTAYSTASQSYSDLILAAYSQAGELYNTPTLTYNGQILVVSGGEAFLALDPAATGTSARSGAGLNLDLLLETPDASGDKVEFPSGITTANIGLLPEAEGKRGITGTGEASVDLAPVAAGGAGRFAGGNTDFAFSQSAAGGRNVTGTATVDLALSPIALPPPPVGHGTVSIRVGGAQLSDRPL